MSPVQVGRYTISSEEKWSLLNRDMRWEVADVLRVQNLDRVNAHASLVVPRDGLYVRYGKRAIDVVVSVAALLVTFPVNLLIAIVTLLGLGRPLFFRQQRLGKDGKLFTLVKFRNMREEHDENGHLLPGELRVTKLGKFLRRTSLDELLNFWSILKGDMSLIGPRPLLPEYGPRFSNRHSQRMAVKPGLECPMVSVDRGGSGYQAQFENDLWYVENVSFMTDLKLAWMLVAAVFDRRQSRTRADSARGAFLGYDAFGHAISSRRAPEWAVDEVLTRHPRALPSPKAAVVGE